MLLGSENLSVIINLEDHYTISKNKLKKDKKKRTAID